jgi:hypothetical protein
MPYLADFILSFVTADRIPSHLTSRIPGKMLFSTWPGGRQHGCHVFCVVVMKDKASLKLSTLFRAHNLVLCIGSFILMTLVGEEVFFDWLRPEIGTYGSLCAHEAYTQVSVLHGYHLTTSSAHAPSTEVGILLDAEL